MPAARLGAGTYVAELLRAVDTAPSHPEVHVLANRRDVDELRAIAPGLHVAGHRVGRPAVRMLWSHTVLPMAARRLRPDLFHGTHYTAPVLRGIATVVTFHDPTFFTHPELHEPAKVTYFTRAARAGASRAARVLAVSEYSRLGAIEHAGADPDRTDVVPLGVDRSRYTPAPVAQREPCVLFVGTLEPRKDVPTLVRAFASLERAGLPHELVLVGPPAWGAKQVEESLEREGVRRVRVLGYVDEDTKIDLYRRAGVFVYPSIAEGFGLPVLEAMACGAPVVTTTGSAPEEIAGDAALLVQPRDAHALEEAIRRVVGDAELADDLGRRGRERSAAFSWTATAEATMAGWQRAVE